MILINCEINLNLTCSESCILISDGIDNQVQTLSITVAKRYISVVTLWTQENVKLLDQLKSGFKRIITWNKYQSKVSIPALN